MQKKISVPEIFWCTEMFTNEKFLALWAKEFSPENRDTPPISYP